MKRTIVLVLFAAACGSDNDPPELAPDGAVPPIDTPAGCDPATVLPATYRPIPTISAGLITVTNDTGVMSGTIDATAGGTMNAPDRPYIYLDLRTGTKVEASDLDALGATSWDIALKRSSLRVNGGDSGPGNRKLAIVQAATLAEVTSAPMTGYASDEFATADCMLDMLPGGEPRTAFGEWYEYEPQAHTLTPKPEVYVLERTNGSRTAFRIVTYYGDPTMPMRGAYYEVAWKQLP
ncbi:MAG: HmuY family protein [Kofleriaceae bacterium]